MDLIADHDYSMLLADISQLFQFFPCPYTADRIVRTAQEEQSNPLFNDLPFKIFKINLITSILILIQYIICNFSVIGLDYFPERIINRFLDQHIVSRFCICLHCHCKCKDNSRCLEQPFRFDLPAVTTFHPGSYCIKICFICLCITIYTMLCLTQQCILNIGTCLKIHICNP